MILRHAERLAEMARAAGMPFLFKSSYDKANRTSRGSFRGPGLDEGLRILEKAQHEAGVAVLTDVHTVEEARTAGEVIDVLQIPAFLCRQTDLLEAVAKTGRCVNVKKGQFLAPDDMPYIIDKVTGSGGTRLMLTERGTTFGYHRLVVDYTGLVQMAGYGWPVVFDATHSVQSPGGASGRTGGDRQMAPFLAYAAAAVGVDGLFVEVHESPDQAPSDGPNMLTLDELPAMLAKFCDLRRIGSGNIV